MSKYGATHPTPPVALQFVCIVVFRYKGEGKKCFVMLQEGPERMLFRFVTGVNNEKGWVGGSVLQEGPERMLFRFVAGVNNEKGWGGGVFCCVARVTTQKG